MRIFVASDRFRHWHTHARPWGVSIDSCWNLARACIALLGEPTTPSQTKTTIPTYQPHAMKLSASTSSSGRSGPHLGAVGQRDAAAQGVVRRGSGQQSEHVLVPPSPYLQIQRYRSSHAIAAGGGVMFLPKVTHSGRRPLSTAICVKGLLQSASRPRAAACILHLPG